MIKQEILKELEELLDIQQIERIIYHKVEELKFFLKDEIDHYRNLKAHFQKQTYGKMRVLESQDEVHPENKDLEEPPIFYFELNKGKNGNWRASNFSPALPRGFRTEDIMPPILIEYIVTYNTFIGKIESLSDITLPELKDVMFDLNFVKYSYFHIIGTIRCKSASESKDTGKNIFPQEIYEIEKKDQEESLEDFIYHLKKYPEVREYYLNDFNLRIKPMIARKIIKLAISADNADIG